MTQAIDLNTASLSNRKASFIALRSTCSNTASSGCKIVTINQLACYKESLLDRTNNNSPDVIETRQL